MICLRIAAATTALLALAGVAVHSLTKSSSAGTDFYTMKREVMETEYCTANPKTCLAIFYDLESRLYTGDSRRQLQMVDARTATCLGASDFTSEWPAASDGHNNVSFNGDWDYLLVNNELQFKFNGNDTGKYLITDTA